MWVFDVLAFGLAVASSVRTAFMGLWVDYICLAMQQISETSFQLVASTAVYATALYWLFYLSSVTTAFGQSGNPISTETALEADKARARTAASVFRLGVVIFAASQLFDSIGLNIEQVVQIGSVFSLGISWSMRDSLSSLWASLLMTFTTDVLEGAEIRFNGEWFKVVHRWSTFVECEWLAIKNAPLHDPLIDAAAHATLAKGKAKTVPNFMHFIPAASLLDRGYTIRQQDLE